MAKPSGPGPDAVYTAHLAEGRFMIQRCEVCGTYLFFPRLLCSRCGAAEPEFVAASGAGIVYSTTVQCRRPEQGGDVNLALVDLAEGPRMMTRIDEVEPEKVFPGMAVRARIVEEEARRFIVFVPA